MKIPLEDDVAARIEARLAKFSRGWAKLDPLRSATAFKVLVLCELLGGRTKAAEAADLADNTLDNYRHGKKDPTFATLELMAEKAGIAARYLGGDWRLQNDSILIDLFAPAMPMAGPVSGLPPGLMDNPAEPYIHGYDEIMPAAKTVRLIGDYWKKLGLEADAMTAMLVEGDSMAPTLADQSPVMIDTADRTLADGGIYALKSEGRVVIRRIQRLLGGGLQLLADNASAYPPQRIVEENMADLEILGRVRGAVTAC